MEAETMRASWGLAFSLWAACHVLAYADDTAAAAKGALREAEEEFFRRRYDRHEALAPGEVEEARSFRDRCARSVAADLLPRASRIDFLVLLNRLDRHLAWARLTEGGARPATRLEMHQHHFRWEFGIGASVDEVVSRAMEVYESTAREMDALASSIDPELDRRGYDARIEADHPEPGDLLRTARAALGRARGFTLADGFVTVPAYAKRVEARWGSARAGTPFGHYIPSPNVGVVRGYYEVIPLRRDLGAEEREQFLRGNNRAWTAVVAVHEAIPGHHLQFSISAKNATRMRWTVYNSALIEGWALYCEHLLANKGYFDRAEERFAQLKMRLWRAARVLLDVGIHCAGLSKEDALRLLVDGVGHEPYCARHEVERYAAQPFYYSGYLVGLSEIEGLRRDRERALGEDFRERAFHDALLSCGQVPFDVLRKALDRE